MHSKPFFSIIVPTYKRAHDLKIAVQCILIQDFSDFEIIISDNNSNDGTEKVVKKFKDSRIKYLKNKRNIGWVPNLKKALANAKGDYILLHGDDDFIIKEDFLTRLQKVLQKYSYGFVRVNYLSYSDEQCVIFDFHNKQFDKKELSFHSNGEQIVNFIESVDPFFMTGIVIASKFLRNNPLIQSELAPWFPAMYKAIKIQRAMLWPEYEFIATWSKNAGYPRYYLYNGKFQFEHYFDEVKKLVSKNFYNQFLDKRLRILISEFPAAKFFTSNRNFIRYALHMLDLDPSNRFSLQYWFWVSFSLAMPRVLLNLVRRKVVENRKDETIPNLNEMYKKIASLDKIRDDKD